MKDFIPIVQSKAFTYVVATFCIVILLHQVKNIAIEMRMNSLQNDNKLKPM